ncbi:hypothetical protein HanIR_Chr10g0480911 [Helianthus annuus]|nr:hypothetical protein HanIR_Chr10g0480911 [Helianthus annuus]
MMKDMKRKVCLILLVIYLCLGYQLQPCREVVIGSIKIQSLMFFFYIYYHWLKDNNILSKLMTSTGSYEDLFKKKIAIYNQICEEMSQNLQAQVQYVQHIQAQNREFLAPSILRITKLLVKVL